MRKPDFCLCENKGADQVCSNCTADHLLCFHCKDSTIPLLVKSSFQLFPVTVQAGPARKPGRFLALRLFFSCFNAGYF